MSKSKNIKRILLIIVFVVLFAFGCISENYISEYKDEYAKAKELLKKEKYEDSINKLESLKQYKLSKIDKDNINILNEEANEKLQLEKYYINAEKSLYNGRYMEALKYYFKNNDEKTKYFKLSKERIMDTLKLYLLEKANDNKKDETISELKKLIVELDDYDDTTLKLYEDEIDIIKETIENINENGIEAVKPKMMLDEDDFYVIKSELGMYEIRNKKNQLRQIVKINGEFSPYEDYYIYKISGSVKGEYELVINFRGHTDTIKGELENSQNILQFYELPEKPRYGDMILVNLKFKIAGEELYENITNEYKIIKHD